MSAIALVGNMIAPGGGPASGCKLNSYVRNTTTRSPLWSDVGLTTPTTNPYVGDADGRLDFFFSSAVEYSWSVTTSDGATTLWEAEVIGGVVTVTYSDAVLIHETWKPSLATALGDGWSDVFARDYANAQPVLNILDFISEAYHAGIAAGTDTHDLALPFQTASETGRTIWVPKGRYCLTSFQPANSCAFVGDGDESIIRQLVTTGDMIDVSEDSVSMSFRHLRFDGNYQSQAARTPTAILRAGHPNEPLAGSRFIFEDCSFINLNESACAIYGDTNEAIDETLVLLNCRFLGGAEGSDSPSWKPNDVLVVDTSILVMIGCTFDFGSVPVGLGRNACAALATQVDVRRTARLTIDDCTFIDYGSSVDGATGMLDLYVVADDASVTNCTAIRPCQTAFRVKTNAKRFTFSNLKVEAPKAGFRGIQLVDANVSTIGLDGQIIDCQIDGVSGVPAFECSAGIDSGGDTTSNFAGLSVRNISVRNSDDICFRFASLGDNCQISGLRSDGGTKGAFFTGCEGRIQLSDFSFRNNTGTFALELETGQNGSADFQISNGKIEGSPSAQTAVLVSGREVSVDNVQVYADSNGISAHTCATLSIRNCFYKNLTSTSKYGFLPLSSGGTIGTLTVQNNTSLAVDRAHNYLRPTSGVTTYIEGGNSWDVKVKAHKNSTNQTGIADSTVTDISFGTEAYDDGGHFASNTLTPNGGKIRISVQARITAGIAVGGLAQIYIYKDGAVLAKAPYYAVVANDLTVSIDYEDIADGTNVYKARILVGTSSGGADTATISGDPAVTWFTAEQIG